VIAFTNSLAKELAVTGIRVNSVAPAAIESEACFNTGAVFDLSGGPGDLVAVAARLATA
jgi:NAD(P)-dependent dehydrogenase (short-subunit alcohol dehydrogenase family)